MIIMVSVEDLLTIVKNILERILDVLSPPRKLIVGYKNDISTAGQRLVEMPTPIHRVVVVKVRSLGTGTYIALGDENEQPFRLTATGASLDIDFIDDLSKVIASTDAGTTGALEWKGG